MTGNIAQQMLDLLPDDRAWTKQGYASRNGRRLCLIGARLRAAGFSLQELSDLDSADEAAEILLNDPYTQMLARIIEAQFPDRTATHGGIPECVINFNDDNDTRFREVRSVLEKARVEWDEKYQEDSAS